jgi:hypothetical protein
MNEREGNFFGIAKQARRVARTSPAEAHGSELFMGLD